jgi:hypothetical protein
LSSPILIHQRSQSATGQTSPTLLVSDAFDVCCLTLFAQDKQLCVLHTLMVKGTAASATDKATSPKVCYLLLYGSSLRGVCEVIGCCLVPFLLNTPLALTYRGSMREQSRWLIHGVSFRRTHVLVESIP